MDGGALKFSLALDYNEPVYHFLIKKLIFHVKEFKKYT